VFVRRIEDYALIGDTRTAALVCRDGSIDWLCLPSFSAAAVFSSLLGATDHGRWLITPAVPPRAVDRRYRQGSLVLETEFTTDAGVVRVTDCMPPGQDSSTVVRLVEGVSGTVPMRMELVGRLDYGAVLPFVRQTDDAVILIGGPDAVCLRADVPVRLQCGTVASEFDIHAGERRSFTLGWHASHTTPGIEIDAVQAIRETDAWWTAWCRESTYTGPWSEAVQRSAMILKALTYSPTGAIVAAATTSLPEQIGGVRNWDYRFCWLRDSAFVLQALMTCGFTGEAAAWKEWLIRAVAGDPVQLRIMYGLRGERRLDEFELPWLPGFENSRPVRVGNAAAGQLQLDVFGEVLDALCAARRAAVPDAEGWGLACAMLRSLETAWLEPDEGIWEVRGPRRHFTHSKVMSWVAFDRAVKAAETFGLPGPVDRWREIRDLIHTDVCYRGFDAAHNTFTQSYGSTELDGSLLLIPLVGFLPADDPRVIGTVAAIEQRLLVDGLVLRYRTSEWGEIDGLPPGEGVFLACSFWLVDNYILQGRRAEAEHLFGRLVGLANDVGLLSEEYDPVANRLLGNFPQAFSHVGLIMTAQLFARDADGAHAPGGPIGADLAAEPVLRRARTRGTAARATSRR
jgi:GH15 family glucan-1,4-alpha-glucosidase